MSSGILLKILSTLFFALMSASAKLAGGVPLGEIVLARSGVALLVVAGWLCWRGGFLRAVATADPLGHLMRGTAGSCGMFCGFLALGLLPLPDAAALGFAAPLFTVALAALVLGEKVRLYRWSAVALGFCGVLAMLWEHLGHPAGPGAATGAMAALAGAVFAAFAIVQTRRLMRTEKTAAIVFYFMAMTTGISAGAILACALWPAAWPGAAIAAGQRPVLPGWHDGIALASVGLFGGLGQISLTESYRGADASVIACFDYAAMIWAVALGLALFGEWPSPVTLAGAGIVSAAGLFVIWRERRLGLPEAAKARDL